ncbi:hypothetical protein EYF80_040266 [Liparis tanakae]|uniref:Uncharacterized protein n=1 Tax=Liparis tanakae TaxID=230148 RepID=A0A4Z2G920_9TELE|nr:hypothetical protein EYF80_040266 [Liparis tanakae]
MKSNIGTICSGGPKRRPGSRRGKLFIVSEIATDEQSKWQITGPQRRKGSGCGSGTNVKLDQGSSWLPRTRPSKDISVKEEIEEDIMEDFEELSEEVEEGIDYFQGDAQEAGESILEEVQEQPSVSDSRENYSYTSISEDDESEKSDGLQEALEVKRRATAALEERKVNEALATTLRKKQAEKQSLRVEAEYLKVQVDDLKKSQKDQQKSKAKLKGATAGMIAEIKQHKKLIEKLQKDLEASSYQHKKDSAERHLEKVNQWASDLSEERTKKGSLQRDYEAAVSQQLKEAEELDHVTRENQLLTSEKRRLQSELTAVQHESQLHGKQLQDDREACSRHGEAIEKEKDRSLRAFKEIQIQEKELSQRTLALGKSLISRKLLRSCLRSEKKRFDLMISEKQGLVERLNNQLRDTTAGSESLMYNMQTFKVENADVRAKFHIMEIEYDIIRSKHFSLSERHEEMTSKKNDTISENHIIITKLQCAVDGLKEQQSESKTRQEDALKPDKTTFTELRHGADLIASALDTERDSFPPLNSAHSRRSQLGLISPDHLQLA